MTAQSIKRIVMRLIGSFCAWILLTFILTPTRPMTDLEAAHVMIGAMIMAGAIVGIVQVMWYFL